MAISTNGGSNPTKVTYNGKNCTEVWYKSSPSATAVKVWPDEEPKVYLYAAYITGNEVSGWNVRNVDLNEYSQVTTVHWNWNIWGNGNSTSSYNKNKIVYYQNLIKPGTYLQCTTGQYGNPSQTITQKVGSKSMCYNTAGTAEHRRQALYEIEDGYMIPCGYWYNYNNPAASSIPKKEALQSTYTVTTSDYLNDVRLTTTTMTVPAGTKYMIKQRGSAGSNPATTTYIKYYTDSYWEELHKEA